MMTLFWVMLAAIFNAVMDRLENENFSSSVFKNLDPKFWYKRESWKYAKKIFGYKIDAWHISKSLMIICLAFAIVFSNFHNLWYIYVIIIGLLWNLTFSIFYNEIFKA